MTGVRVKDALDAVDALVGKLVLALRGASSITLIAAALVLGGALAAGQRFRVYDAVVLKTLGATPRPATAAYAIEYLLIGLADGGVRRRCRLARRRPRRHPGDGLSLRLGGAARPPAPRFVALIGHGGARPCRHVLGARPQARGSVAKSLTLRRKRRVKHHERFVTLAKYGVAPSGAPGAFALNSEHSAFGVAPNASPGDTPGNNPGVFSMSDFDRNFATARAGYRTDQVAIDAGLRAYMIRVYNYMASGVALTGVVAWLTYQAAGGDAIHIAGGRSPG